MRLSTILSIIGLLVVLALGFGGGLAWERRPDLSFKLPLIFWHPRVGLPGGLAWRLDRANQDLVASRATTAGCYASLAEQTARVRATADEAQRRLDGAVKILEASEARVTDLRSRADRLHDRVLPPVDHIGDVLSCSRWNTADAAVLEALR